MRRLAFLAAFAGLVLAACQARAEPPVWVIRDKNSTITLFGSVHVLPQGEDWRPAKLKSAIARADDLWFEIPFDTASRTGDAERLVQQGFLPAGQTLTSKMKPADVERLRRIATTFGQPLASFERMKPWMADIALSQAFAAAHGGDAQLGVEEVLNREAPARAKRRAFETPDQQIATLAEASEADQYASLAETLREIEEEPGDFQTIVGAWMKGDTAGLIKEAIDPLRKATPGIYERLIKQRNANWVPIILNRLAGSGDTVMVVGVGHLVGPDSVPAMLRARGITVEGP